MASIPQRSGYSFISSSMEHKPEIDHIDATRGYDCLNTPASSEMNHLESFRSKKQSRTRSFLTGVRWVVVVSLQLLILLILLVPQWRMFKSKGRDVSNSLRVETGDDINNLYETGQSQRLSSHLA